jgi:hypothetical protein
MACEWRTELGNEGHERGRCLIGTSLACCMGIALELFHIEF